MGAPSAASTAACAFRSVERGAELSRQGLLSEVGTSIYGDGPERAFERSGALTMCSS